jgi:hypothetical protein
MAWEDLGKFFVYVLHACLDKWLYNGCIPINIKIQKKHFFHFFVNMNAWCFNRFNFIEMNFFMGNELADNIESDDPVRLI